MFSGPNNDSNGTEESQQLPLEHFARPAAHKTSIDVSNGSTSLGSPKEIPKNGGL
jgi:hypothetical protein